MIHTQTGDIFAAKRAAMRDEFFGKLFLLGGWLGGTDTYKRTMWTGFPEFATGRAAYHLTLRRSLNEPGAGNQYVMAGHEAMMAQWFHRPLQRTDIELTRQWYSNHSGVRAFPNEVWDAVMANQPGEDIYLPVDVWGFPGGQTFLKGVPCISFEGMGGPISYLEPSMCRYFLPIIQATKARLMRLATPNDAEFGLRSAPSEVCHLIMLLARYVGGGGGIGLTSNDTAQFMYPELFRDIGTIGHELMCANQSPAKTLSQAEFEMLDQILTRIPDAKLLTDLVDPETVGLINFLEAIRRNPAADKAGARLDSADIIGQCVLYYKKLMQQGSGSRIIVYEDEVRPETIVRNNANFRQATGVEPTMLFPGAGGYWWRDVHRDTVSAAFKRSATEDRPNVKFSGTPGKESLAGYLRVYGKDDTMIVADVSETIDGEPLFVKLVENGRFVYSESFQSQAARSDATWGKYTRVVLSPLVQHYKDTFAAKRASEVAAARQLLSQQQP